MRQICTCRLCKQMAFEDECVKYSTRHYAHLGCYVEAGKDHTQLPACPRAKVEAYLRRNDDGMQGQALRGVHSGYGRD